MLGSKFLTAYVGLNRHMVDNNKEQTARDHRVNESMIEVLSFNIDKINMRPPHYQIQRKY